MSSILDALNKLEQEKAQARREQEDAGDPVNAAHDLVGRSVLRDRVTVRISPATVLISGGAILIALIAIAITLAILVFSPETPTQVATAPGTNSTPNATPPATGPETTTSGSEMVLLDAPQPTPMPAQVQSAPPRLAAPEPSAAAPASQPATTQTTAAATTQAASAPVQQSAPAPSPNVAAPQPTVAAPAPKQEPPAIAGPVSTEPTVLEPVAVEPEPEPVRVARRTEPAEPRPGRTLPAAGAQSTRVPEPEDLSSLPVLTPADIAQYGLVQLKINMPTPSGPRNPQGSAVLTVREEASDGSVVTNTMKFYENQRIQSTQLRLFKVEATAVGIEDMRSGQRYRLPF